MLRTVILAALCAVLCASSAEARPKHRAKPAQVECFIFCPDTPAARPAQRVIVRGGSVIGGRPKGCPRAFCGCGASLKIFGKIIPRLNLARNWFAFPRTSPAPGMVAVRRHHVFVLEHHIAGKVWMVHDSNSGGGKTRRHPRSIAGYQIVNPHGSLASRGQAL